MARERVRQLDPQAVEATEYLRKNNFIREAAVVAASALGISDLALSPEEVSAISRNPEQRAVLACLARIQVDSLKTIANRALTPPGVIRPLSQATSTIASIYQNPAAQARLRGTSRDHRSRNHLFLPEMARDTSKVVQAASVIYPNGDSSALIQHGESILEKTRQSLPPHSSTRHLITVEIELSRLNRGAKFSINDLLESFSQLSVQDMETNPHRVATVASWLTIAGEKVDDARITQAGWVVFDEIIDKNPGWNFMIENEKRKQGKADFRRRLIRLMAPLSTSPRDRIQLKDQLLALE